MRSRDFFQANAEALFCQSGRVTAEKARPLRAVSPELQRKINTALQNRIATLQGTITPGVTVEGVDTKNFLVERKPFIPFIYKRTSLNLNPNDRWITAKRLNHVLDVLQNKDNFLDIYKEINNFKDSLTKEHKEYKKQTLKRLSEDALVALGAWVVFQFADSQNNAAVIAGMAIASLLKDRTKVELLQSRKENKELSRQVVDLFAKYKKVSKELLKAKNEYNALLEPYDAQVLDSYKNAVELLPYSVAIVNANGVDFGNRPCKKLFTIPLADGVALDITQPIPAFYDEDGNIHELYKSDKVGESFEGKLIRKQAGEVLGTYHVIATPILFGDRVIGKMIIFEDITQEETAKALNIKHIDVLKEYAEKNTEGVVVIHHGKVVVHSQMAEEFLGIDAFQVDNLDLLDTRCVDPNNKVYQDVLNSKESRNTPHYREIQLNNSDGTIRWISVVSTPELGQGNKIVGIGLYMRDITERKKAEEDVKVLVEKLDKANYNTVMALAELAERHEEGAQNHLAQMYDMAKKFALALGKSKKDAEQLARDIITHDIGKMWVDEQIFKKTKDDPLTTEDWKELYTHPEKGADYLERHGFSQQAQNIARGHHARFDGIHDPVNGTRSYPQELNGKKLAGRDIPEEARITTIIDVVSALAMKRSYHDAIGKKEIEIYLKKQAGGLFDPDLVEIFLSKVLPVLDDRKLYSSF